MMTVDGQLFNTKEACCFEHGCDPAAQSDVEDDGSHSEEPNDVVTFSRGDVTSLPWIQGGTGTHVADWHLTTEKTALASLSIRSGDLNGIRGKSSDVKLKVDSTTGARISFLYWADVGYPFDYLEFRVDGELKHKDATPSGEWIQYSTTVSPGPHEISLHVISPPEEVTVDRDVQQFGTGVVYVDEFKFTPF